VSRVVNTRNNRVLVQTLEHAKSMGERLVGLIGRKNLDDGQGLWILRSGNSIHTCFMKFPIDVVFVNKKGVVKYTASNIKPWRLIIAPLLLPTDVLEMPAGVVNKTETRVGDTLRVES
jgi:uncharacterized membrane protein (UPF0127 family)